MVYYNKDAFNVAGVEAPVGVGWSFSEFLAACDQIQASGVIDNGVALRQHNGCFEEFLGNCGGMYFNNNNGRTGRATEVSYHNELGVEVFEFLTGLVSNGYSPNLGSASEDVRAAFITDKAALIFDSSGAGGNYKDVGFDVGTMFIPYTDSSPTGFNGPVIGGGALWLIDSGDSAVNMAAWECMKLIAGETQQITWYMGTGYFPVRNGLIDNAELQAFWEEKPFFKTGVEQLAATKAALDDGTPNYAVLAGRAGPYPSLQNHIKDAFMNDGLTPKEALDRAAEAANQELADYNAFFE
jgi:sn-glycerol 3-phosphate transport system substrate-binding protein